MLFCQSQICEPGNPPFLQALGVKRMSTREFTTESPWNEAALFRFFFFVGAGVKAYRLFVVEILLISVVVFCDCRCCFSGFLVILKGL